LILQRRMSLSNRNFSFYPIHAPFCRVVESTQRAIRVGRNMADYDKPYSSPPRKEGRDRILRVPPKLAQVVHLRWGSLRRRGTCDRFQVVQFNIEHQIFLAWKRQSWQGATWECLNSVISNDWSTHWVQVMECTLRVNTLATKSGWAGSGLRVAVCVRSSDSRLVRPRGRPPSYWGPPLSAAPRRRENLRRSSKFVMFCVRLLRLAGGTLPHNGHFSFSLWWLSWRGW